jgi:pimeloyl-ACP methyl ester carboxylesterase
MVGCWRADAFMTEFLTAADGTRLAWRELGKGRPLLLIHGYFSDATTNWITYGTAARLAASGFRCIMPDLRAHGESARSHDPARYPADILADDQFALIAHLGLKDYDLAGYSLGARTATRMLARGAKPGRAILSGMGLEGLTSTGQRSAHFRQILRNLGSHPKGSAAWMAEAFLKTTGGDPVALDLILETFVDTPRDAIARFDLPVGIICGADDQDNGSAGALAALLARGELITIPGNHMSAVTRPAFGEAFAAFLKR